MTIAPNLTVVLQQTHDVSKIQEVTQRQGEAQQQVAALEVQQQRARERSQIQRSDRSDGNNKITPDGGRERRREEQTRDRTPKEESVDTNKFEAPKGLLDVVV